MIRPSELLSWVVISIVRVYQRVISPLLGPRCRFTPSCSEYLILALKKYGLIQGMWKAVVRICKCHPWHPGGHDLP